LMRALIAGGGGFIGSHLADLLLARGDEVVAVDHFVTGRPVNVAHLRDHDRFTIVEHDITTDMPAAVLDDHYDAVLDLASPASPLDFATLPLEILAVGSTGTRNLLELAKRDTARFFLASTSEVYGDPLVHPQPENYWGNVNPIGPRGVYDEAKRYAEALTMAYHRQQGVDTCIVRIFNTYGPRMRAFDGRAIPTFVRQAISDQPITIFGDGSQTRSFCYVADLVDGLVRLAESGEHLPVNIGNPNEYTMIELAEAIIEVLDSSSTIVHESLPVDDPQQRKPDIGVARELLGWEPKVSLLEGLRELLERSSRATLLGRQESERTPVVAR
ncbi:MAG: NAD-dependent epimerase/dehydratase, partial [Thermoleophilia bacterium]|nr:NAD-dependent epimerase/dehydratase [Thermoleophilia bacterium]